MILNNYHDHRITFFFKGIGLIKRRIKNMNGSKIFMMIYRMFTWIAQWQGITGNIINYSMLYFGSLAFEC